MTWKDFWTSQGVFKGQFSQHEQPVPVRLLGRIAVPKERTIWESAAMVELAARIGLHLLGLDTPIYSHLFEEVSDTPVDSPTSRLQAFRTVVGADPAFIHTCLQAANGLEVQRLLEELRQLPPDTGLLYVCRTAEQPLFVITGSTPRGVLTAARYLVTDGFGRSIEDVNIIRVLPRIPCECASSDDICRPHNMSLHNIFTQRGLLNSDDVLHPSADFVIALSSGSSVKTIGAVELAASIALAAAEVHFPVTCCEDETVRPGCLAIQIDTTDVVPDETTGQLDATWTVSLESGRRIEVERHLDAARAVLRFRSREDECLDAIRHACQTWFQPADSPAMEDWRSRVEALVSPHPDVSVRARLAVSLFDRMKREDVNEIVIPDQLATPLSWWKRAVSRRGTMDDVRLTVRPLEPIKTFTWSDPGELAELEKKILDCAPQVAATLDGPPSSNEDAIVIEVLTTVAEHTFTEWQRHWIRELSSLLHRPVHAVYRNAHKSGLHWAMNVVLPALKRCSGRLRKVRLQARRFAPDAPHLDMVHRYLQELYPFDEIVAQEIGIPLDDVELGLSDTSEPMFSITALDDGGHCLGRWEWNGMTHSVPYMPERPEMGNVCVPLAGFRILDRGRVLYEASVKTNAERFWAWYQQVLRECPSLLRRKEGIPKFYRLTCEVWMDAEDVKLPVAEESVSILEALHEDIYFYSLHWFHEYGKHVKDAGWDAPGAIVPLVHAAIGQTPYAKVSVYPFEEEFSALVKTVDGRVEEIEPIDEKVVSLARVTSIEERKDGLRVRLTGIEENSVQRMCEEWVSAAPGDGCTDCECLLPAPTSEQIRECVMYNEHVEGWVNSHRSRFPGTIRPVERSFQGREIWLLEAYRRTGVISPPVKHRIYKPTLFINARHHANEVSSTNAVLQLAQELLQDGRVLDCVNIVMVPLENVDGAELHRVMAEEHPYWKHHAARYNACGLEFAYFHFQPDTPFGESRVYKKVWEVWCPDVILDDHGVPSHEWVQLFSGYNSPPRFPVSYWLPIAQMYTIWYEIEHGSSNWKAAYESLLDSVTSRLDTDQLVRNGNARWLTTFRRWGHAFEPRRFPINLLHDSLTYTRVARETPTSHLAIERWGEVVAAELITEVNDETVHGAALSACRHAHHVVHKAILDWLCRSASRVNVIVTRKGEGDIAVRLQRERPVMHVVD